MLISLSKILIVLVLVQYVTSAEFYKSKRVPPKYKEIRRTYSPKNEEENADSKPTETIVTSNPDQDKASISNEETKSTEQPTLPSSTIKPKRRNFNLRPLKKKGENAQSKPVDVDANEKANQAKMSAGPVLVAGDKTPTPKPTTAPGTTQPKRRTFNAYSLKNKARNDSNKPIATVANKAPDQDKMSINNEQTTGDKKTSITTSTTVPKRRTLNLDSLKIHEQNPTSEPDEIFVSKNSNQEDSIGNVESEIEGSEDEILTLTTSTVKPKRRTSNMNNAAPTAGSKRILKTQRKILVQKRPLDAETKNNINRSTVSADTKYEQSSESFIQTKVTVAEAPRLHKNYFPSTTPVTRSEKKIEEDHTYVPIVGVENYVYAHSGDYHYSYEGGDGTKAFERGELKSVNDTSNTQGVVGGYSYKDKDGNDFSLSYTAGKDGYQPVGAHLPTPPPIPPAIQRVLRILATKTTPEPITESINSDY